MILLRIAVWAGTALVHGYAATGSSGARSDPILVAPREWNVGVLYRGQQVSRQFVVLNVSDRPVRVWCKPGIGGGCGDIGPSILTQRLEPGAAHVFSIVLTAGRIGRIDRTFEITAEPLDE